MKALQWSWWTLLLLGASNSCLVGQEKVGQLAPKVYSLEDFVELSLARNPALRQTQFEIEAAEGRVDQAGRYLNHTLTFGGEEIGPKAGIQTMPLVSQEIITAQKRRWARAVAEREMDQAFLARTIKRYDLLTDVRQGFFDVLSLQKRWDLLETKLIPRANQFLKKFEADIRFSKQQLMPFQIDQGRLLLDLETTKKELASAWRKLAAVVGVPELAPVNQPVLTPKLVQDPFANGSCRLQSRAKLLSNCARS
ncbi:MAG: TolC family protein [Gemmataceae bacterium]|nr:TolC family protein [Gemmataceae bacterium]MCI0740093.1 TolC family protein [Gemmataceae bacterium]